MRRLLLLSLFLTGCAAKHAQAPVAKTAEVEPVVDTIGEFRRGERIACAEGTDLVYVVSRDRVLHSFDPTTLRFRAIGALECPGTRGSHPHSMAVDRSGQAWVLYDNGVLGLANIRSAECSASAVNVPLANIGRRFGMGFAPTPEGGIGGETLFLATEPLLLRTERDGRLVRRSSMLARIDDGRTITLAAPFPSLFSGTSGELSSRSDGKLFAFFAGDPFRLAEIDPQTAEVKSQKTLDGIRFSSTGIGAWAFAAVGTDFFFFWADKSIASTVTRLKEDGSMENVISDAGMAIVGAGASTCATKHAAPVAAAPAPAAPAPPPPPVVETPPAPPPPPKAEPSVPWSKLPKLPPAGKPKRR